jgi:hypothetical protein
MRMAEAWARGTMMKMTDTMMTENMICVVYWMKAIREPICTSPLPMARPPNQTIMMVVRFIISMMKGKRKAIR